METRIYLLLPGFAGPVKDPKYKGWIEVDSFIWGRPQPNTIGTSGPGVGGTVRFDDLSVQIRTGVATPELFLRAANGRPYPTVRLAAVRVNGASSEKFYEVEMTSVMVTSIQSMAGADSVSLNFERMSQQYFAAGAPAGP